MDVHTLADELRYRLLKNPAALLHPEIRDFEEIKRINESILARFNEISHDETSIIVFVALYILRTSGQYSNDDYNSILIRDLVATSHDVDDFMNTIVKVSKTK